MYLVVFFLLFFTLFFTFYCILSVFMDCWSDTNKMMMMMNE